MKKITGAIAAVALMTATATPALAADSTAVTQAVDTKQFYSLMLSYLQATMSYNSALYTELAKTSGFDAQGLVRTSLNNMVSTMSQLNAYLSSVITVR